MKTFFSAVSFVLPVLFVHFATAPIATGQSSIAGCSNKMLSERIVDYIKVNALAGAKGDARVRRIGPSGSPGICIAEVEYSFGDQSGRRATQRVYLSSDGRFVFPRAIDLSLEARENILNALRIDGFPAEGERDSPVVVIEFADFQCPPCRLSGLVVKKNIQQEYGNKVLWVYKWLPSPTHSWAREAAVGSICTHLQSPADFWRLHDLLLTQQRDLSKDSLGPLLLDFAAQGRLDLKEFNKCITTKHKAETLLETARSEALSLAISGTPTIIVNGRRVLDPTNAQQVGALVAEELQRLSNSRNGK